MAKLSEIKLSPTIRLNAVVNHTVNERIERIRAMSENASLTKVLRRALAIYEELLIIRKEGSRIIIESNDGKRKREVLRII